MSINYLDGVDIIYWINLDRAKERKIYMEQILKDDIFKNIKKERITAVDAKEIKNVYNMFDIKEKKIKDAEYACLLSHLETINTFSKTNYENALIFEDDISLEYKKYWTKTIQEVINNAPKDWEILKLIFLKHNPQKKLYNLWKHKPKGDNDFGCISYLINNKAAKKLINDIYHNKKYKLEENIRHEADIYIYLKIKTYSYKYPFFTYRDNNNTYIQSNVDYKRKSTMNKFYKKISQKQNKTKKNKTKKIKKNYL